MNDLAHIAKYEATKTGEIRTGMNWCFSSAYPPIHMLISQASMKLTFSPFLGQQQQGSVKL